MGFLEIYRNEPFILTEGSIIEHLSPEPFADAIIEIHKKFGIKILGGCCGTDPQHIREIARKYRALSG